ncbi:MAG: hypothetical protein ACLGH6_03715 [Gammaproteobacteria bacterium]
MDARSTSRTLAYACIAAGIALAFVSAVVPHYGAGYRLAAGVLAAGLVPYFVYALALPLLRSGLTTFAGLLLVAVHAGLVLRERFAQGAEYADGMIYGVPVVLAVLLLALLWRALREPWGAEPAADSTDHD